MEGWEALVSQLTAGDDLVNDTQEIIEADQKENSCASSKIQGTEKKVS